MNKKQESLSPSLKEKQKEFPTNVKKLIGIASRLKQEDSNSDKRLSYLLSK